MRRIVLGVALLLLCVPPARASSSEVVDDVVVADRLHELTVSSAALGRDAKVRVLLPTGYDDPANAGRQWPILWLLHGVGDDQSTWTTNTDVEGMTADLPLVVAMPEGGRGTSAGWYSDWVDGPDWETFHLTELLPLVESRYGAGGARERRVIAGLSMGGYGAMAYAARHPDLWLAAASFSGAVHPTLLGAGGALVFELLGPATGTPGDPVWGPWETSQANWRGHDPFDLAANLRPLAGRLFLRSGNGLPCPGDSVLSAPLEVGVYPMNLALHGRLAGLGIAHQWFDRGCGTHQWNHWSDDLAVTLPKLMAALDDPPPAPASFSYRFTDDRASVFGWTFVVDGRPRPTMTVLEDVSADGLTVSGVGRLTVTMPSGSTFSVGLAEAPTRVTAPSPSTTTTTTVPRSEPAATAPSPAPAVPALPTTGGSPGPVAGLAVVGAMVLWRLSGAGAGGRRPTRSG